jgi:uncharacterized protein YdhG (YjbR/CyaY superfamily)
MLRWTFKLLEIAGFSGQIDAGSPLNLPRNLYWRSTDGTTEEAPVTESFSKEEKAAMRAAAAERRRKFTPEQHAAEVLENYQAMDSEDRAIGLRIHEIVMAAAPQLAPKTWYGMPAYYKDGKNICFFQAAGKFKVRYGTFGFDVAANLDDGPMWSTGFAVIDVTKDVEKRITEMVKRAVS